MHYVVEGTPIAWAAHGGYGKKSFNPRFKEKEYVQWQLKLQHGGRPLIEGAVRIDFFFEMPIPKSLSKKLIAEIKSDIKVYHYSRPDRTNLLKFHEDCLIGTVLIDDNVVCAGTVEKYYAKDKPRTLIFIKDI